MFYVWRIYTFLLSFNVNCSPLIYGRPMKVNRTGHIYFHPLVCSSFFFPRLIAADADWMSTILPTLVRV